MPEIAKHSVKPLQDALRKVKDGLIKRPIISAAAHDAVARQPCQLETAQWLHAHGASDFGMNMADNAADKVQTDEDARLILLDEWDKVLQSGREAERRS